MDSRNVLPQVAALTRDLAQSDTEGTEELRRAQHDLIQAMMAGQTLESIDSAPPRSRDISTLETERLALRLPTTSESVSGDNHVFRQSSDDLPFGPGANTRIGLHPVVAVRSHGPFTDRLGHTVRFDVVSDEIYKPLNLLGGEPIIYTSMDETRTNSPFVNNLGPGYIRLRASAFVEGAPSNSFFKLRILSGEVVRPPVNVPRSVNLKLAPPEESLQNPQTLTFEAPMSANFQFQTRANKPAGTLVSLGLAKFGALGNQVTLQFINTAAKFDNLRQRINFPMQSSLSVLQPVANGFQLVDFSGKSDIDAAAWSLPVIIEQPNRFGAATDESSLALYLKPGLVATITGQKHPVRCGNCVLLVQKGGLFIHGFNGDSAKETQIMQIRRSIHGAQPDSLQATNFISFRSSPRMQFTFLAVQRITETWHSDVWLDATLDQPRNINNQRLPLRGTANLRLTKDLAKSTTQVSISAQTNQDSKQYQSFALRNFLFTTWSSGRLGLTGLYDNGIITEGKIEVELGLLRTLPFLPDPYATNLLLPLELGGQSLGNVTFLAHWSSTEPVTIRIDLGPASLASSITQRGNQRLPGGSVAYPPSFREKEAEKFSFPDLRPVGGNPSSVTFQAEPMLLDVSSNAAQFGVMFPVSTERTEVNDLTLHAPSSRVDVITMPAVNWEPVQELNRDLWASFEPGPTTRLAIRASSGLTPISPREALQGIVAGYSLAASVVARVSLPFGMVAVIDAGAEESLPSNVQHWTKLKHVQPAFSARQGNTSSALPLKGVDQVSLQKLAPIRDPFGPDLDHSTGNSPDFRGTTALLDTYAKVAQTTGAVSGLTNVLSGPGSSSAVAGSFTQSMTTKVPLTRIDLTGYGESTFSDWRFRPSNDVGISKVALEVMNGRAARETIQMVSIIAPFAVRVVRQIDIVRLNNGGMISRNSGWQPTSSGEFVWPPNSAIKTCSGVVVRAENVSNIRDITNELVRYDCTLVIDDPAAPEGVRRVSARDQVGYVFIGTSTQAPVVEPGPYMDILRRYELGGEVDLVMNIGRSSQKMRVTSVRASATAQSKAVISVWGSLIFAGEGQWSMCRQKIGTDLTPQTVNRARGVPLVRDGESTVPTNLRGPYLVREPSELLDSVPTTAYGIIHGAASFRVIFQHPEIPTNPASPAGSSTILVQGIKIADKYALARAEGIFPDLQSCLPLGKDTVKQILEVHDGHLKFGPLQSPLDDIEPRVLRDDAGAFKSLVSTKAVEGDGIPAALLKLGIDSKQKQSTLDVTDLALTTLNGDGQVVSKVVNTIKDDAQSIGEMLGVRHIYGPALDQVRTAVGFLEHLKLLPDFKVTMTDPWGVEMTATMTKEYLFSKLGEPASSALERFLEQFDLTFKLRTTLVEFLFKMHIKVTVKVPTGFGPVALGVGGFDLALGTGGTSVGLELGVGIGVDFSVGFFKASASYAQSQTIKTITGGYGIGITATLRASVDLVVASASLYLEASMFVVKGPCTASDHNAVHKVDTIYAHAQVRICFEVSIFLVIHVKVDEETHWENKLNSGRCELKDMQGLL